MEIAKRLISDSYFRKRVFRWLFHFQFKFIVKAHIDNIALKLATMIHAPAKSVCIVCGWQGWRFESYATMTYYRPYARCPQCGALPRHRALVSLLIERKMITPGMKVLHIAPTVSIMRFMDNIEVRYVSLDLRNIHADIRGDVQRLPFHDSVFDLIICFHVLEFVEDWKKAIREFHRVLSGSGYIILSENYMFGQLQTLEFDEKHIFTGHPLRRFGNDLPEYMKCVGFCTEIFDYLGKNDETGDYFFIGQK